MTDEPRAVIPIDDSGLDPINERLIPMLLAVGRPSSVLQPWRRSCSSTSSVETFASADNGATS